MVRSESGPTFSTCDGGQRSLPGEGSYSGPIRSTGTPQAAAASAIPSSNVAMEAPMRRQRARCNASPARSGGNERAQRSAAADRSSSSTESITMRSAMNFRPRSMAWDAREAVAWRVRTFIDAAEQNSVRVQPLARTFDSPIPSSQARAESIRRHRESNGGRGISRSLFWILVFADLDLREDGSAAVTVGVPVPDVGGLAWLDPSAEGST